MGILQNLSNKAAGAANARMLDGMKANVPDLACEQVEVVCSIDPKFHHLGIRVTAPSGTSYFFHRCGNQNWFVSKSQTDFFPQQLVKMVPHNPATHEPVMAAYVHLVESQPLMDKYEAIWLGYFENIGMGVGLSDNKISEHKAKALDDSRSLGALREFRAGTSWVNGTAPETNLQKGLHKKIDGLQSWYTENGVASDDIKSYWDKSPLEQCLIWESSQVLAVALTTAFIQTGQHESLELAMDYAAEMYRRLAPSFSYASKLSQEAKTPDSKFPLELYERVTRRFMGILEKKGIQGLETALGKHSSMAEYLRVDMTKGKF
jgi:hypothetical protein